MHDYESIALEARKEVLRIIHNAHTSHIGSNFSCVDILTVLYASILNVSPALTENRDRMVISKGWAAAAAYYFLYYKGIISKEQLDSFPNKPFKGLLERSAVGVEASTGSAGHGLPVAVGIALGAKRSGASWKTYVLMSDGEMNIGTTWEAALIAAHHNLNNLMVIVDVNGLQAMGPTTEILDTRSLMAKWTAFNWEVRTVDGHRHGHLEEVLSQQPSNGKPVVILAKTVKGKGVSFMENRNEWHYRDVDDETYIKALSELHA